MVNGKQPLILDETYIGQFPVNRKDVIGQRKANSFVIERGYLLIYSDHSVSP